MSLSITIIGTGNVAWHLAPALEQAGHEINEVFGRSKDNLDLLAQRLNNPAVTTSLDFSQSQSSLFIIAVNDNSIGSIVSSITIPQQAVLVHTSGTAPLSRLQHTGLQNSGVFYPLQTFSKSRNISFVGLPLLYEASNAFTENLLLEIGESLGADTTAASSKDRQGIHLAAVFANNFTNHMINIANKVMEEKALDGKLLKPLIGETVAKALAQSPSSAQTGPAARGDTDTIQQHIQQLEFNPRLQDLYRLVSESIRDSREEQDN